MITSGVPCVHDWLPLSRTVPLGSIPEVQGGMWQVTVGEGGRGHTPKQARRAWWGSLTLWPQGTSAAGVSMTLESTNSTRI